MPWWLLLRKIALEGEKKTLLCDSDSDFWHLRMAIAIARERWMSVADSWVKQRTSSRIARANYYCLVRQDLKTPQCAVMPFISPQMDCSILLWETGHSRSYKGRSTICNYLVFVLYPSPGLAKYRIERLAMAKVIAGRSQEARLLEATGCCHGNVMLDAAYDEQVAQPRQLERTREAEMAKMWQVTGPKPLKWVMYRFWKHVLLESTTCQCNQHNSTKNSWLQLGGSGVNSCVNCVIKTLRPGITRRWTWEDVHISKWFISYLSSLRPGPWHGIA